MKPMHNYEAAIQILNISYYFTGFFLGICQKNSMKKELNFFAKTQFFAETQSKFGQKPKIPQILANILVIDFYTTCTFLSRGIKAQEFLQNSIEFYKKTQFWSRKNSMKIQKLNFWLTF